MMARGSSHFFYPISVPFLSHFYSIYSPFLSHFLSIFGPLLSHLYPACPDVFCRGFYYHYGSMVKSVCQRTFQCKIFLHCSPLLFLSLSRAFCGGEGWGEVRTKYVKLFSHIILNLSKIICRLY